MMKHHWVQKKWVKFFKILSNALTTQMGQDRLTLPHVSKLCSKRHVERTKAKDTFSIHIWFASISVPNVCVLVFICKLPTWRHCNLTLVCHNLHCHHNLSWFHQGKTQTNSAMDAVSDWKEAKINLRKGRTWFRWGKKKTTTSRTRLQMPLQKTKLLQLEVAGLPPWIQPNPH